MKKAAVIQDLSGFGRCSLAAALPVISAMGVQACPLPSAILSNQTGYSSYFCTDYTPYMPEYIAQWHKMGAVFDGIYTGFLASEQQIQIVKDFVVTAGQQALVLVDPVMGEGGKMYPSYTNAMCQGVKQLAAMAQVITPNVTECCILTGCDYNQLCSDVQQTGIRAVEQQAKKLLVGNTRAVVVTGIHTTGPTGKKAVANLAVGRRGSFALYNPQICGGAYSGTGDLFASALFGGLIRGWPVYRALGCAVNFVLPAIASAASTGADPNDGVEFEKYLYLLTKEV